MNYTVKERSFKIESLFSECTDILNKKGNDYSQNNFANSNFSVVGDFIGCTKYATWGVYFYKHVASIMNFVKSGKVESEPIRERIKDAINYLAILATMIEEDKFNEDANDNVGPSNDPGVLTEAFEEPLDRRITFIRKLLEFVENENCNVPEAEYACVYENCENCFFAKRGPYCCRDQMEAWIKLLTGEGVLYRRGLSPDSPLGVCWPNWDRLMHKWRGGQPAIKMFG